jgi:hypothetical protein
MGEQIARGEPPLAGIWGAVHVAARKELRSGALDRLRRCSLTVGGRPRHHRLASCEGVLLLRQPARAGQLAAHQPQIRDLGRTRWLTCKGLELAGAEAVLGRPGAHDLLPRRSLNSVALALARVVRDRLTPRAPHLDASRDELALALLDLPAARGELPQHLGRDLLDLGHPVAHRPPTHPRKAFTDRGAQVCLIEKTGRLGVLVDRRAIKRRPTAVGAPRHVRGHDVRVQLRILRPAHAMAIAGRHEPLPGLAPHPAAAATHPTRLALQIGQGGVDGRLVRLDERTGQRPIADGEQDTDRLGRRERQIERRHLRPTPHPSEPLARTRMTPLHQRDEALLVDHADEPQVLPTPPGPTTGRLAAPRVVVIAALGHLALVIARLLDRQLADRQHREPSVSRRPRRSRRARRAASPGSRRASDRPPRAAAHRRHDASRDGHLAGHLGR